MSPRALLAVVLAFGPAAPVAAAVGPSISVLLDLGAAEPIVAAIEDVALAEAGRPPRVEDLARHLAALPDGRADLLVLLGESGALAMYDVTPAAPSHVDFLAADGRLAGGPRADPRRLLVHLPLDPRAVAVGVAAAEAVEGRSGGPSLEMSAVYALETPAGESLWIAGRSGDGFGVDEVLRLPKKKLPSKPEIERWGPNDLASSFDIVVTGDGFTAAELPRLRRRVEELRGRLLGSGIWKGVLPFSDPRFRDRIAFHLVALPSKDSGISGCPKGAPDRDTIFRTRGRFTDDDMTAIDTEDRAMVEAAFAAVGPPSLVEARAVIPNCPEYGGRGFYNRRLAIVPYLSEKSPALFTNLFVHELAHSAVGLTDEYTACAREADLEGWPIPNIATPRQVAAGRIPWSDLADPETEKDAKGRLIHRHECKEPDPTGKKLRALGMFWGSPFIDAPQEVTECDDVTPDKRLCGYYHAMWYCKMRDLEWSFCRVCQRAWRCAFRRAMKLKDPECAP